MMQAKDYKKAGRKALASTIRSDAKLDTNGKYPPIDKHINKGTGRMVDQIIAKTSRLELGEKLRAAAKRKKKARTARTVKQALTGRKPQET